jgi:hypothetical protein
MPAAAARVIQTSDVMRSWFAARVGSAFGALLKAKVRPDQTCVACADGARTSSPTAASET